VLRERAVRAHHEVDAEPALLQDRDGRVDAARDGLVDDELDRARSFALRWKPMDAGLGERAHGEPVDGARRNAADDEAAAHWPGSFPCSSSTARAGSFSPLSKKRALASVAIGLVTICSLFPHETLDDDAPSSRAASAARRPSGDEGARSYPATGAPARSQASAPETLASGTWDTQAEERRRPRPGRRVRHRPRGSRARRGSRDHTLRSAERSRCR
jgi:hypothetical protein